MGAISDIFKRDTSKRAKPTKGTLPPTAGDQCSGARSVPKNEGGRSGNDDSDAATVEYDPPAGEEKQKQEERQQKKMLLEAEAEKILAPAAWHVYKRAMDRAARGNLEGAVASYAADVALLAECPPGSGDIERLLEVSAGGDVDMEAFRRCLLFLLLGTRFPG